MNAWKPIKDLPQELLDHQTELESLAEIWQEQKEWLEHSHAIQEFNQRLKREWAIETGIIENLYSIDRGVTQLLIEKGLDISLIPHGSTDRPAEEIVPILKDQENVIDGLFDFIKHTRPLSISYIKALHAAITTHQENVRAIDSFGREVDVTLLRGEFKKHPNNPTRPDGALHEYSPPEQVDVEMEHLLKMHHEHQQSGVSPLVESAWLHHRFAQIHPFQDGNGRIARTLASLVLIQGGWFPLVVTRDQRSDYLDALEEADRGELMPLINLFKSIQKRAFLKALSLSESVLHVDRSLNQAVEAAVHQLKSRQRRKVETQDKVFEYAELLSNFAYEKLQHLADQLHNEISSLDESYFVSAKRNDSSNDYWYRKDIIEIAKQLDYFADTRSYHSWLRLKISEDRQTDVIVSIHSLGVKFCGVLAVTALIKFQDQSENEMTTQEGPYPLCQEVFQFSYNEDFVKITTRFSDWLDSVFLAAIDSWKRQL